MRLTATVEADAEVVHRTGVERIDGQCLLVVRAGLVPALLAIEHCREVVLCGGVADAARATQHLLRLVEPPEIAEILALLDEDVMIVRRNGLRLAQKVERLGQAAGGLQRRGHLHQHIEALRVGGERAPGKELAPRRVTAASRECRVLQQQLGVPRAGDDRIEERIDGRHVRAAVSGGTRVSPIAKLTAQGPCGPERRIGLDDPIELGASLIA